jgi:uncharacterized protein (TIGR03067 family)
MKTLICCAALLFLAGFKVVEAGEKATDLDRLQGTWLVVTLTENGKTVPAKETEVLELVVDKDTMTTYEKGKVLVQYKVKLDPTKTPKMIDFTHQVGDDKGKTEPGIYAFDKDHLKMSIDDNKKGRPTVFEGKETAEYSVIVLKKKAK